MQDVNDWRKLFWARIYRRLDQVAARTMPGTAQEMREARDACKDSLLRWLQENGFAHVHGQYRGKASPEAYFLVVLKNRLLDCLRKILGRPRVPQSVQSKGATFEKIYELYYLKKRTEEQIINAMASEPYHLSPEATRDILFWLWARFPVIRGFPGQDDPEGPGLAGRPHGPLPGEPQEISLLVKFLWDLLMKSRAPERQDLSEVPRWVWQLGQSLKLDATERLVLQMLYRDGMSPAETARILTMPRRLVENARKQALEKIRAALEALGFGPETPGQLEEIHKF